MKQQLAKSLKRNKITTAILNVIAHNFMVLIDKDLKFFAVNLSTGQLCIS